ncbi:phosphonate C-P lyase system protein PhnL [Ancylobacter pratisalsi]|uniref:Phosphonate C-P lyase system protein PhnL n=1 Tax=Ancylobacter pratisalsi TaxID=1745854 RepID=A0A6P1YHM4_9HYPH|nr:phosphonate C-P lyase system protein PhnL [Ancylobacter pratisalsi]QIB32807.1 phosphonate C-P lyase system protein PhnL [Ancylobacter pratisalsi]
MSEPILQASGLSKTFVLHLREGARLPVVSGASFELHAGECVALGGPSGAGKSSLLKMVYGNYRVDAGAIRVRDGDEQVDVARAAPRRLIRLRAHTMGYVSQFLRVIPRVSALDVVADPLLGDGVAPEEALPRARALLGRLNLPERLWPLPPATFSGGEQQRVNIARGLIAHRPLLLMDEPTASLDAANRQVVVELIGEKKRAGVAILGIFHDSEVREAVCDRVIDVTTFGQAA